MANENELSDVEISEMLELNSVEDMKSSIRRKCVGEEIMDEKLKEILVDFFFSVVSFGMKNGFDSNKISKLLCIMKQVHNASMQQQLSIKESFRLFKENLIKYSVHRPPFSIELFNVSDVLLISEFAHSTYYKHFKMYQYAFRMKQIANVTIKTIDDYIEKWNPKPLSHSYSLEKWEENKKEEEELQKVAKEQGEKSIHEDQELLVEGGEQAEGAKRGDDGNDVAEATVENTSEVEENISEGQKLVESVEPQEEMPKIHPRIAKQLEEIKQFLLQQSSGKFCELSQKIEQLEGMVAEQTAPPPSKSTKKKK